jgi:hypothetical protein
VASPPVSDAQFGCSCPERFSDLTSPQQNFQLCPSSDCRRGFHPEQTVHEKIVDVAPHPKSKNSRCGRPRNESPADLPVVVTGNSATGTVKQKFVSTWRATNLVIEEFDNGRLACIWGTLSPTQSNNRNQERFGLPVNSKGLFLQNVR